MWLVKFWLKLFLIDFNLKSHIWLLLLHWTMQMIYFASALFFLGSCVTILLDPKHYRLSALYLMKNFSETLKKLLT